jgi:hypothetical protein
MASYSLPHIIVNTTFDSELRLPNRWAEPTSLNFENGGAPVNNALLTLKLRYKLEFADSKNQVAGVIVRRDNIWKAKDAEGFAHPILDWDDKSRKRFTSAFERGEKIWNLRFQLLTPLTHRGFDFSHPEQPSVTVRPNVACLFGMSPSDNPHVKITVVRVDRDNDPIDFRAHEGLYHDMVPWRPTLGHELGHAIGLPHIKVLLGDAQCMIAPNEDRCYGETEEEKANIMGSGTQLLPINAKPWLERIAAHTTTAATDWTASLYARGGPQLFM